MSVVGAIGSELVAAARPAGDCIWEIPPDAKPGMRVPARIYASEALLRQMDQGVFEQVTNVACLPGIVRAALCMPDGHWGYGFPTGGVAAFDAETGVISPGGIGFDINCGMRLLRTALTEEEVRPHLRELAGALFSAAASSSGPPRSPASPRRQGSPTRTWLPSWTCCTGSTCRARSSRSPRSATSRASTPER
jgi:hypothetical protein